MLRLIIAFIIPISYFLINSLWISAITKREFGDIIGITMLGNILILFCTGFFDLRIGLILCFAINIVMLLYTILSKKSISIHSAIGYFKTPSVIIFLLVYCIVFALNFRKDFYHWDELSHWGIMVKDLLHLNHYYFFDDALLTIHGDYPPLLPLIEYMWCRLCMGYKEGYLYTAKIMLCVALILPLICHDKMANCNKKGLHYIIGTFLIILAPLMVIIGEASYYRSIYAESLMAVLFVACMMDAVKCDWSMWGRVKMALYLFALTMTKQIAIFFAAVAIITWVLVYVIRAYIERKKVRITELLHLLVPLISFFVWKEISGIYISNGQFNTEKLNISSVLYDIRSGSDSYRATVFNTYINSLFTYKLQIGRIEASYVVLFALLFIISTALVIAWKRNKVDNTALAFLITTLTFIPYAGIILASYLYGFTEFEALRLSCYNRYMNTIVFAAIFILVLFTWRYVTCLEEERGIYSIIVMAIAMITVLDWTAVLDDLTPGCLSKSARGLFEGDSEYIVNNTEDNASVFIIYQNTNGNARDWLAYLTYPRTVSSELYSVGAPYGVDDVYTVDVVPTNLIKKMSEYDYVYLGNIDEKFTSEYKSIFDDDNEIFNQSIYRTNATSGKLQLVGKKN